MFGLYRESFKYEIKEGLDNGAPYSWMGRLNCEVIITPPNYCIIVPASIPRGYLKYSWFLNS